MKQIKFVMLILIFLLLVACGGDGSAPEESAEPTPEPATPETVVETVVVVATPTDAPPEEAVVEDVAADSSSEETAVSADAPVLESAPVEEGSPTVTTLIDLNVRTGPGTNYAVVGVLKQSESANIVGKSPNGHWWKIQCPEGVGSECWTSAGPQYSTPNNAAGVPVAAVPAPPATHTPTITPTTADATYTPTATTDPNATATATTDPNATPTYTPTATKEGDPTATYTATPPTDATPTPTATTEQTQIADLDNDSLQNPAQSVFFSPTGTKSFTYSNAVSYANGDQEDWVEFEFPNNSNSNQVVWITLDCTITGDPEAQLRATIYEDGNSTNKIVICNQGETQLTVDNTKVQQVRIHWGITKDDIYANYTITVVGFR